MKLPRFTLLAAVAAAVCMLAACAAAPGASSPGNEGAGTASGQSGIEVFGTIDAAVSNTRGR